MTTVLLTGLSLQSCSYFKPSECKNPQAIEMVKQLYATQVNGNPLSQLTQWTLKSDTTQIQTNTPTTGIELTDIKQLDLQKLQFDQMNKNSIELATLFSENFENADILCQATLRQEIKAKTLARITQYSTAEYAEIIQDDYLNIPVVYGIYQHEGNQQFDVQYSTKKRLYLVAAMALQKSKKN